MLIVKIQGGLGNQLFQYAFASQLAMRSKTGFKLDVTFYEKNPSRKYELCHFGITGPIASVEEINAFKTPASFGLILLKNKILQKKKRVVTESGLRFNPSYLKPVKSGIINGYWQSEKYFMDIAEKIKTEFTLLYPPTGENLSLLQAIKSGNSISVHVRRGDYDSDSSANQIHGTCSIDYYHKAAELIAQQVQNPIFYIFSDDMAWVRNYLKFKYQVCYVEINDSHTAFEDLRLMQHCHHHIIANSTFSWWGAWLNPKKNKIVVAPKRWFNDEEMERQATDILPDNWIRL